MSESSKESSLEILKKNALKTGEGTRSFFFVEITHEGKMTYTYWHSAEDLGLISKLIQIKYDDDVRKRLGL